MTEAKKPAVPADDPWTRLRRLTSARIGLGRVGVSHATADVLQLSVAHALARDAVHQALDVSRLQQDLDAAGFGSLPVHSQARDRDVYLARPDLGRLLAAEDESLLRELRADGADKPWPLAVIAADGVSARAGQEQAVPLLLALKPLLDADWFAAPVFIGSQARVAFGDEVATRVGAAMVLVMIGERPGLSSPDSMGLYLTWAPQPGIADSRRNCLSNIRPAGLTVGAAARRLAWLMQAAVKLGRTGVALKDRSEHEVLGPADDPAA